MKFRTAYPTARHTHSLDCLLIATGWHFGEVKGLAMEAILQVMTGVNSKQILSYRFIV